MTAAMLVTGSYWGDIALGSVLTVAAMWLAKKGWI